jgi:signal transduction histidine kinase
VVCSVSEIQQVVLNLLTNAAQALAERDADTRPRIILRAWREPDYVCIEVEDNGPGIPADIRKRVFDPFFSTKEVGVGTGLGLSVSYFIITQNHSGTMEVSSIPGEATRFTIRLPAEGAPT